MGHLGPDLLGPDWDEDEALRRLLAEPDRPVAEALLDQRNLAGIGNMYAAELCFTGGRPPRTPVGDGRPTCRGWSGARTQMLEPTRARAADDHRRPAPRPADLGLPPRPAALPPLRHARAGRRCSGQPGRERASYWCPSLPAGALTAGAALRRRRRRRRSGWREPAPGSGWPRGRATRRPGGLLLGDGVADLAQDVARAARRGRSRATPAARRTPPSGRARSRRCSRG